MQKNFDGKIYLKVGVRIQNDTNWQQNTVINSEYKTGNTSPNPPGKNKERRKENENQEKLQKKK